MSIQSQYTMTLRLPCYTDLYACKSNPLKTNSSVILDEIKAKGRGFQRRIVLNTSLCSSHSSSNQYLEIKLKYFYDVCAVTTWMDISRLTDTNFKIKFSENGLFWSYYSEMGKVKVNFLYNFSFRSFWSEFLPPEPVDIMCLIPCLL